MKKHFALLLLVISTLSLAQSNTLSMNDFKYVLVPQVYDFQSGINEYRLNSTMKFRFVEAGFTALIESTDYPMDLRVDPCKALKALLIDSSSAFKTTLSLRLVDCHGNTIYQGEEFSTKEKVVEYAYKEILEMVMAPMKEIGYTYDVSNEEIEEIIQSESEDVFTPENAIEAVEGAAIESTNETFTVENSMGYIPNVINHLINQKYYQLVGNRMGLVIEDANGNVFGKLLYTLKEGVFLYNSTLGNGTAHYDSQGNLVIDYINIDGQRVTEVSEKMNGQRE